MPTRRRLLPTGLTGLAALACAACCAVPLLVAAGVVAGGGGVAAVTGFLPGVAAALVVLAGLAWAWAARPRSGG
jgi:hypothetical protein